MSSCCKYENSIHETGGDPPPAHKSPEHASPLDSIFYPNLNKILSENLIWYGTLQLEKVHVGINLSKCFINGRTVNLRGKK